MSAPKAQMEYTINADDIITRLHKSRSSRSELEFDLSNFV